MSRKVDLNAILLDYCNTGDVSLITEDFYDDLQAFCRSIANKYAINNPKYLDFDEFMSICNDIIWKSLKQFNPLKSSPMTYLTKVINNAILMDIRNDKRHNMSDIVYLEDILVTNNAGDKLTLIETLADDSFDNRLDDVIINKQVQDIVNKTLLKIQDESREDSVYKNIITIYDLIVYQDKTQRDVGELFGVSRARICRIMKCTNNILYQNIQQVISETPTDKQKLKNLYKNKRKSGRKVICTTTGEIFNSLTEAAKAHNVFPSTIYKVCNHQQQTTGQLPDGTRLRWRYY